jgi:S-DNA-T family DNA segregation ATPase FtsK/SpoIIIE
MANAQRSRTAQPAITSRRRQDITGLLIFFLGAAGLVSLSFSQPGLIPEQVSNLLRLTAGIGAYAIPLLLMFIGTMFLIGYERLTFTHASFGTLLLFLVFVIGRHLAVVPHGMPWNADTAKIGGGWIGALAGSVIDSLCGRYIGGMFLVLLTLIAVVLLVDQPLIVIARRMHERGRAGAVAAQRTIGRGAKVAEAMLPGRTASEKDKSGQTSLPAVPDELSERDKRVARVAERALAPAPEQAALVADERTQATDDHRRDTSSGSIFNLFNLTKPWFPAEAKEVNDDAGDPFDDVESHPGAKPTRNGDPAQTSLPAADSLIEGSIVAAAPEKPFVLPPLTLLKESPPSVSKRSPGELTNRIRTIEQTLEQFNIGANVVEVASGPSVTRYEIQLAPGIKVNKIVSLADNLAMSLAAIDVRVEAPIPGKSAIGLEVPNATPMTVSLRECLDTDEYRNATSKLTIALGKDVAGQYKYADLARMPHLLIGGSTNSGKSVCLNTLIASLLYRATPREVKMLMIDPKRVELSLWDGIPHLMYPVVKDVKQAAGIFRAAIKEMDKRYDLFQAIGTRNIDGYNEKVHEDDRLAYIVLIVDELADLMMQQGPEIEQSICRLAQLARATGIHLVIATQRPSVDIITGTIKANISSRIAFAVASQVDSRTILDMTGADRLVGRGDMLFMPIDASKPLRIQGCYLGEAETNSLVQYLKEQEKPVFSIALADPGSSNASAGSNSPGDEEVDDQFFEQAVRLVVNNGQASTSMLQRRFRIGYTRAARIVEMMEEKRIVGPLNGAKPREICISRDEVERMFNPGGTLPSVAEYRDDG